MNARVGKLKWSQTVLPLALQLKTPGEISIKLDRGHALGNPFFLPKGKEHLRPYVIEHYERWLVACLQNQESGFCVNPRGLITHPEVEIASSWCPSDCSIIVQEFNALRELLKTRDLLLLCWCTPLACHIDVIIKLLLA